MRDAIASWLTQPRIFVCIHSGTSFPPPRRGGDAHISNSATRRRHYQRGHEVIRNRHCVPPPARKIQNTSAPSPSREVPGSPSLVPLLIPPLKHDRNHPLPPDGKGSTSFPKNQNRPLPQDLGVTCAQSTQICAHEGTRNPSGSSVIFLLGMYTILNRDPTLRDLQFSHLFGIFFCLLSSCDRGGNRVHTALDPSRLHLRSCLRLGVTQQVDSSNAPSSPIPNPCPISSLLARLRSQQ